MRGLRGAELCVAACAGPGCAGGEGWRPDAVAGGGVGEAARVDAAAHGDVQDERAVGALGRRVVLAPPPQPVTKVAVEPPPPPASPPKPKPRPDKLDIAYRRMFGI